MNEQFRILLQQYITQQIEAGYPADVIVSRKVEPMRSVQHVNAVQPAQRGNSARSMPASVTGMQTVLYQTSEALAGLKTPLPPQEQPHRAQTFEQKRSALVELYYEVKNCHSCPLGYGRTKLVFGSGNAAARIVVIGEGPGEEEDRQGKPFVGNAGQLLTKMLAAIGLDRDRDVFITNVVKCRPPHNRDPNQEEIMYCVPLVKRQIRIIAPQVILLLGRSAASAILNRTESIGMLRTQNHTYEGVITFVTYHPAALLRNSEYKRPAWEDLQKVQTFLKERGFYGQTTI